MAELVAFLKAVSIVSGLISAAHLTPDVLGWLRRRAERRSMMDAPTVELGIAGRALRDDATEEMLLAGMDALRATPAVEDLAGPEPTVHVMAGPCPAPWPTIGQRRPTKPLAMAWRNPWRPPALAGGPR